MIALHELGAVEQAFALRVASRRLRERKASQTGLGTFTRRMFPGYETPVHIRTLIDALTDAVTTPDSRLIVTLPPRHGKSLTVSEHLPAWYLGNHPDCRYIAASHTAGLAYTFSRRVRNKMADPRWPFPDIRVADDKGAVQAWDIQGHAGGYVAVGVGGGPTGIGAQIISIDDPIRSAADADSQTIRDGIWEWYRETLRTRLEPGGSIILTATRWHEDDLTGRLMAEQKTGGEQWMHIHLPAVDDNGGALWPERWSLDALERLRVSVGTRAWEAQFQGRPSPAEGGMFKRHWWRYWQPRGSNLPPVAVKMPDGSTRHVYADEQPAWWDQEAQSWDMAFKETRTSSYVVGLVGAMNGPNLYLIDCFRDRVGFTETVRALETMTAKHPRAGAKWIEDKANGPAVMDTLSQSIPGLIATPTDGSKEARAHAATPFVEAGNAYLPHPLLSPWVVAFVDELARFPAGANDDQVDSFSQLVRRMMGGQTGVWPASGDLASIVDAQLGGYR